MMEIQPVTLAGRAVRLEPLSRVHLPGLLRHGLDPDLWTWMPVRVSDEAGLARYIDDALDEQQRGVSLPFATVEARTGEVAGSTRYLNIERKQRRVEIGSTWVMRPWQRSAVNTEAKYLMLRHAFEQWCCLRVELKTDVYNVRSRTAIQRIGAREEGIFRSHLLMQGGRVRDTAYYGITYKEWPEVKRRLLERMAA
jgi:RimJ/RimL family protein N-acetyltransferase